MSTSLSDISHTPVLSVSDEDQLSPAQRALIRAELDRLSADLSRQREGLVLWKAPLLTLWRCAQALGLLLHQGLLHLSRHTAAVLSVLVLFFALVITYFWPGPHQAHVQLLEEEFLLAGWWIGLGILSSVGLGTGLHTFLLYLGPHIALVTLAATECQSLAFDEYGPNAFICQSAPAPDTVTFWSILRKIQWEAVLWGFGTALGELPPYFVARTARAANSNSAPDELTEAADEAARKPSLMARAKMWVIRTVERVGFVGILLFASIPNPLFDLAGLTCGHIGVPFWTFFSATAIGKAIVKVHGQAAFVITLFNVQYLDRLLDLVARHLPPTWQENIRRSFEKQRATLHRKPGDALPTDGGASKSALAGLWDIFLGLMIGYFVVSIVHSLAQQHQAMLDELALLTHEADATNRAKQAGKARAAPH
jgi:membrane protein YqaA with SNARE-associated domain